MLMKNNFKLKSNIKVFVNSYLIKNSKFSFSSTTPSCSTTLTTKEIINQRDQHFRSLLLKKEKLTSNELSNVARVLYKNKNNITEEEARKFDDQALLLTKSLDNQQLRQVISYYVFTNKVNKFVNYEINQRYKTIGLKDYTQVHVGNDVQAKFFLFLFGIRNGFFKILSKVTGLSLK